MIHKYLTYMELVNSLINQRSKVIINFIKKWTTFSYSTSFWTFISFIDVYIFGHTNKNKINVWIRFLIYLEYKEEAIGLIKAMHVEEFKKQIIQIYYFNSLQIYRQRKLILLTILCSQKRKRLQLNNVHCTYYTYCHVLYISW